MTRSIEHRYRQLPERTPQMLFQIVQKFYRGAVSHYDFIQQKKEAVQQAARTALETGEQATLDATLDTLFCEFHLYVTCWLQIELALYRLARKEDQYKQVLEKHRQVIELHIHVRSCLDDTIACVKAQWEHYGEDRSFLERDEYWFCGRIFSVNYASLSSLHQLYQDILSCRMDVARG